MANPELLILARESCGMTQAELATATGIPQSKLSRYENQLMEVDVKDLNKIAASLEYDVDFFYQTDRVYGLGSSALFNRKRLTIPLSLQKQAQSRVNLWRIQITRLLRSVEIEAPETFRQIDLHEHDGDIRRVVSLVRAMWKMPLGPVNDLTATVENAGGIVVKCDFGTPKIDAAHLWVADLPPMFFMNSSLAADRYRFTLAHEVGHAIMHRFPDGDIESEANRFAAELLMPADEIAEQLVGLTLKRAATLKPHWKVSMASLIYRAKELECITDRQYKRLNEHLSGLGYRTNEPIPLKSETPSLLRHIIEYHRKSLRYNNSTFAKALYRDDWSMLIGDSGAHVQELRLANEPISIQAEAKRRMM